MMETGSKKDRRWSLGPPKVRKYDRKFLHETGVSEDRTLSISTHGN